LKFIGKFWKFCAY